MEFLSRTSLSSERFEFGLVYLRTRIFCCKPSPRITLVQSLLPWTASSCAEIGEVYSEYPSQLTRVLSLPCSSFLQEDATL